MWMDCTICAGSKNIDQAARRYLDVRCLKCGREQWTVRELTDLPPHCACGGMLRPGVVWFGEMLPEGAMERAAAAVRNVGRADRRGNVRAGLSGGGPDSAGDANGGTVIEVNPDATDFSDEVDLRVCSGPSAEMPAR